MTRQPIFVAGGGPAVLVAALLALGGCGRREAPAERAPELATVEVTAAPDAALSTAEDRIERRASPDALAGALPDGFPPDIPVFRPASLVDFAPRPEGGYLVVFASPTAAPTVAAALGQKLRAAGWQEQKAGVWTKGGRRLQLAVEATAAGARYRIEF